MHPYIRFKPHDSFPMTSHGSMRHPVAFGARAPRKSESVDYNLQFLAVFATFLDFSGPGHIFSRNIPRSADVTYNVARVLGTICVASKSLKTPNLFISRNLNLPRNERKFIHIFVPSHMTPFQ